MNILNQYAGLTPDIQPIKSEDYTFQWEASKNGDADPLTSTVCSSGLTVTSFSGWLSDGGVWLSGMWWLLFRSLSIPILRFFHGLTDLILFSEAKARVDFLERHKNAFQHVGLARSHVDSAYICMYDAEAAVKQAEDKYTGMIILLSLMATTDLGRFYKTG